MPRPLRSFLAPVTSGLTYRRYVHLLLGAVIALPYAALVVLFVVYAGIREVDSLALLLMLVVATGAAVGVALVPGVRALEITAARALLGATVPDPDPATEDAWPARRRAAGWLLLNLLTGAVAALVTLIVLPSALGFLLAPWRSLPPFPTGAAAAWMPVAALLMPVLLLHAVAAAGAALARLAPRFLGPTPAERMAVELARSQAAERALAERNRLARELHDWVGHALTVTTLQAGAAARVLDTDPAFVARALDAIAEAGRSALADLDHVLGLLREGDRATEPDRTPQPDLTDLDALLAGARSAGVTVDAELVGAPSEVPRAASREAYRILQEGLTNALRHAGPVPVAVRVEIGSGRLDLELTNPLGAPAVERMGGGRGLAGMRERVRVLRGELFAGPDGDVWRVAIRLPLDGRDDRAGMIGRG
ncbi:sensor histidine kinase [Pseudonocardia nigra]|uniref:sensor histidine kinase n=1 Tax=Pseudonocardia nigra TaxID=1921578 RepID=UPI0027E25B42|nr:histidine kinase [Pseudonocardia nigra]